MFVDPGAFNAMFMGVGILKVKSLFRKLRKLAVRYGGVIVFFDEADSLGSRGALTPGGVFGGQMAGHSHAGGPMTGPFATAMTCNGLSYVNPDTANQTLQSWLDASSGPEPERRRLDRVMPMGMGGGGMGTLQALLAEMSGLKKPKGFMNRVVRKTLGLKPKSPPKYRMLIMMATNMPQSLDEALLRPGRIDRIYKVGYPSKPGRVRTYEGYLSKVSHELTPADIDKLATITPYATGATIKDTVNESLINAIRAGRDAITWQDVVKAKQMKDLGPPEDVEYIERERHAVAVHEACHAVAAYRVRAHMTIDIATIEKGGTYLGMVASIPPEDQFTRWRSDPGVHTTKGVCAWINFGPVSLEPAELMKISFIVLLARYLDIVTTIEPCRGCWRRLRSRLVPVLLILKQPDLGMAMIFVPVLFVMLFVAGAKLKHLALIVGAGLLIAPLSGSAA